MKEYQLWFFNMLQNKQQDIIHTMYKDFDERLYTWQAYHNNIFDMPEILKHIQQVLEEWKNKFLTKSSVFFTDETPEAALNKHLEYLDIFLEGIKSQKEVELSEDLKEVFNEALGIKLELSFLFTFKRGYIKW